MSLLPQKPQRGENSLQSLYKTVCDICDYLPETRIIADNRFVSVSTSKAGTVIKGIDHTTASGKSTAAASEDPYDGKLVTLIADPTRTNEVGFKFLLYKKDYKAGEYENEVVHFAKHNLYMTFYENITCTIFRAENGKLYTDYDMYDGKPVIATGGDNNSGFTFRLYTPGTHGNEPYVRFKCLNMASSGSLPYNYKVVIHRAQNDKLYAYVQIWS